MTLSLPRSGHGSALTYPTQVDTRTTTTWQEPSSSDKAWPST
ncbi:hypothetical protein [Streptomyces sp. WM6386]|nr:hypothetical protein [Streptomyces sp. WM6386]